MSQVHKRQVRFVKDFSLEPRAEIFRSEIRGSDPFTIMNITNRVESARDQCLAWLAQEDTGTDCDPEEIPTDLWYYFDAWINNLWVQTQESRNLLLLDPGQFDETWQRFLALVPAIYVAVIDAVMQDPAKLDYVKRNQASGDEILRIARPIKSVLPNFVHFDLLCTDDPALVPTAKEQELGRIVTLVAGARGSWPVVNYGSTGSN
ncbi:hypothetical protein [Mycobacteroides abscessus]|uniref:hypothetical protein n=1 Tax=Mycobacteroides abscessus TaxID=36809 RepID=UPI0012FFE723|nr:hypothetical protein [Mycobacteroides abscessus]